MLKSVAGSSLSAFMIFLIMIFTGCFSPKISIADKANGEMNRAMPGTPVTEETGEDLSGTASSDNEGGPEPSGTEKKENSEPSFLDAAMELVEAAREYWVEGDPDKSLEALDQAYALIATVESGGEPVQEKEDLRFLIAKRILEIHASRYAPARGTHKAIPVTMNKHVEREIELFKNRERKNFLEAYKRSGKFRGEIVKALQKAGLPEELSWLPLTESGFNVRALSRGRALGLWQFIPSTGYKFGLARTNWVDERMDPAKSTAAAIAYLKELHSIFGDWPTVLLAYNCGERAVLRAIRKHKIDYLDNFWGLYELLPAETARHYPRFLAVLAILKDQDHYGIDLETPDACPEFEVANIQKRLHLNAIAQKLGVPIDELTSLNPELRQHVTPASDYSLRVPVGKSQTLLAGLDQMKPWKMPQRAYLFHRIRRGENLSLLALKYRTSISAIEAMNNLRRKQLLRVGQKLKIPLRGI